MRPLVFTLLLLALSSNFSHAKRYDLDSLKLALKTQVEPTERMKTVFWICSEYNRPENIDDDSLRMYAEDAMALAASLDSLGQQATFMTYYAATYFYSDTAEYLARLREAEELHIRSNNRVKLIKAAFMTYNICMQRNEFKHSRSAISTAKRGLAYLEQFDPGDSSLYIKNQNMVKSKLYGEMIEAYLELSDYDSSIMTLLIQEKFLKENKNFSGMLGTYLQYYEVYKEIISQKRMVLSPEDLQPYKSKLLETLEKAKHLSDSLPSRFGRKGIPELLYGVYYEEEGDLEKAKKYYHESIVHCKRGKRLESELKAHLALAGIHVTEKNLIQAYEELLQADTIARYVKYTPWTLQLYEGYAEYYLAKGEVKKADENIKRASELLPDNAGLKTRADHYALKHKIALANKQPDKALEFYKKQILLKDSLAGLQLAETLVELRGKYMNSQKDVVIAQLNEEKVGQKLVFQQVLGIALLLIMIIIFVSIAIYQRNRNKILEAKKRSSELKHSLLRSQMNPHFTFNALGAIQNYLLVSDQPNKAAYFLAKFAKLMRQILDQSVASLISIEEELDTLENYLTIQKLRYDSKFEFRIDVSEGISIENTKIPPVLIQPLLENAIEHGKIHKKEDGFVTVEMSEEGDFIIITVKDNGVGLNSSRRNHLHKEHNSVSTSIIKERIQLLRSTYGDNIKYHAAELAQGGTETLLVLPKIVQ